MHQRTAIRRYAVDLLKGSVDVGGRVYANRPSPVFFDNLPCVLVYFQAEPAEVVVGNQYSVKEYQRNLRLVVDILVEEQVDQSVEHEFNQAAEDLADKLAFEVERAMYRDWTFARQLPGYASEGPDCGLLLGLRLVDTTPYNIDSDGDRRIVAQRIEFEAPYMSAGYVDLKYADFLQYQAELYPAGAGADVPRLESEGDVR